MSYQGFGIASGPTLRPNSQPLSFGSFDQPSSFPSPIQPRKDEALDRMRSPHVAAVNSISVAGLSSLSPGSFRPSDPIRNIEQKTVFNYNNAQTPQRPSAVRPFSASPNFAPGVPFKIPQVQELKRTRSPNSISRTTTEDVNGRPNDVRWNNERKPLINYDNNSQMLQRPSAAATFLDAHSFRPHVHDVKRTTSPSYNSRNISQDVNRSRFNSANDRSAPVIQRTSSPPLGNNHTAQNFDASIGEIRGTALSSPAWVSRPRSPCDYSDLLASQDSSPAVPFANTYESKKKNPLELANGQILKRTRSPPLPSGNVIKRPSMSPPTLVNRSNIPFQSPGFDIHQSFLPSIHNGSAVAADTKPISIPPPKRNRSPPVPSAKQAPNFTQDETERESQAKAKRLARFKVELSQPESNSSDIVKQKFSRNINDHPMVEMEKSTAENSMEIVGDFSNGSALPEYEAPESSSVIIGLCPDMCPGSERAERERKGDLDQYERFDGDRNQTNKSLAVKKYTRTAEREAILIRPMPILQKTIDYLIDLLEQPYDHRFLGMYNFLWDRMRAIRMDLRMQHIFNLRSISMLEQMIRLHIIAMHELCEYTKGEGFSEGFDAHLNIEQMNKTSVELFQMYDDHRKKGINVPTEKEFRGYYALLKLDKHPGYKVDPAELSLDLAKMTPQIRQTPEVLFARNVARSCRIGNFIAFFRYARGASYLQACLMHAHFAKLRTQALASLHSGLQNNQGLPISTVAMWFGMEEEDIEGLSDYHGFVLKEFEEPYMVKEGPFLNSEKDYPTKCSKLVHLKRSTKISEDVSSSCQVVSLPEEKKKPQLAKIFKHSPPAIQMVETPIPTSVSDEDMIDPLVVVSPKADNRVPPIFTSSLFSQQSGNGHQVTSLAIPTWNHFPTFISPQSQPAKVGRVEKQNVETLFERPPEKSFANEHTDIKAMPSPKSPVRTLHELSPGPSTFDYVKENSALQNAVVVKDWEIEKPADIHQETEAEKAIECSQEKEAFEAKLKLILRIWRRRSSKLKELREQRLAAANAALTSLSLGPSIRHQRIVPNTFCEFNIDAIMRERSEKHERSWSRLNVSDVLANQLIKRNPDTKCLCFKLIVCSQTNDTNGASSWLLSKLMPSTKDDTNNDLVISLPGVSIWNKWLLGQSSTDLTCCMSVIKDANFGNLNETVSGASAVLFLVSENISWELQKIRLQNVLVSVPPNSSLPLLILKDAYKTRETSSTIIDRLGLSDFDKSRISEIHVEKLQMDPSDGFYNDERLRGGLQWLASKSPSQPVLKYVKTRELVVNHLNSSLDMVSEMSVYDVAPHHCITAFNDALDRSISEVAESASTNPSSWPCPEINLLDEYSPEYRDAKLYLPSIGWSSSAKIEPIICALNNCKLPAFSDDISWLGRGCNSMGEEEIEFQRSELENCIVRYMTKSSHMMDFRLAANEAHILIQNNAGLELHDSSFYIVPNWVMMFRRIFNWRLSNLSTRDLSSVYICEWESDIPSTSRNGRNNLNFDISASSPYRLMRPSLDEMVDVGCSPIKSKRDLPESEVLHNCPQNMGLNPEENSMPNSASESILNEVNLRQCGSLNASSKSTVNTKANKEADKLSKLLESCNLLQNMIDKKLSVYF